MMLCNGPGDSSSCVYVSNYFIDGTPCGYRGQCLQGNCMHGSTLDATLIVLSENKNIAIPVGIAIFLILCAIGYCCYRYRWCCCSRIRSRKKKQDDGTTTEKVTLPEMLPKSTDTLSNENHDRNDVGKSMHNLLPAPQPHRKQDPWFLDYSSNSTLGVDSVSSSPTVVDEHLRSDSSDSIGKE
jgi:hypothetical protein